MSQPDGTEQVFSAVAKNGQPDPEVVPKAKRRTFNVEYKRRILREADACSRHGEIGSLLRREGLYSSHLSNWRRQREEGTLAGPNAKKRGRQPTPEKRLNAELKRENARLQHRLEQAETIIDVQKKLARLLQSMPESQDDDCE